MDQPQGTAARLAVTTCVKPAQIIIQSAQRVAAELGVSYAPRRNVTVETIFAEVKLNRLLIVMPDRWLIREKEPKVVYQYHPNMALVRAFNLVRGARDLFIEATQLKIGDSLLDCTVGFAAEASLAAMTVGPEGRVVGLESVPELAVATREGLKVFPMHSKILCDAMRRVEVINEDYREYLITAGARAFDAIYFDPFFEEPLTGAEHSMSPLAHFGNSEPLDTDSVILATRVARNRVVIKHPWFEQLPRAVSVRVSHRVETRKGRLVYSVINAEIGGPS